MALDTRKFERKHTDVLRDIRPMYVRLGDWLAKPSNAFALFFLGAMSMHLMPSVLAWGDLILIFYLLFFWWLTKRDRALAFKMPYGGKYKDPRNSGPGRDNKPEGILFLGNVDGTGEETWFTNSDARTHILYLGTTGSGKTEGLKSMVSNALTWGSGFVYIDGKADTDLWSSLSSMVRRFGRDDDLLVVNYMTGNSDVRAPSNTMNPFSAGSASYLTNMLVSLMPEAEGDNAMWKERAVSLISSLMPAMTWKRDHQDMPLSIGTIRDYLNLPNVIKLSRDQALPDALRASVKGYLDTLPGYIDAAWDDDGKEKPMGPDTPNVDTTTPRQQHGYLSMQFTRALQSLGDDYGYIFDTQAADVDMVDVVLNRRIMVVLIPALEKSSDETANLGKIIAATIKGMMGSTLGASVEGESATVIENKPTHSSTPFMCVFDEVGYYTASGMAVMAAQARSLGFSLVFSAQDLPALEKRVKEEARSITANCNIKIFGKLEDPTQTKEFFEKTVGSSLVMEASSFQLTGSRDTGSYYDTMSAGLQIRPRASYDALRGFKEGQAVIAYGDMVVDVKMYYSNPGMAKAMRVTRFVSLPPTDETLLRNAPVITKVRDLLVHKSWTAMKADVAAAIPDEIAAMAKTLKAAKEKNLLPIESGMAAIASVFALHNDVNQVETGSSKAPATPSAATPAPRPATTPNASGTTQAPASAPPSRPSTAEAVKVPPIFGPKKTEQAAPPQSDSVQAQAQANPPAQSSASPMAFFKKKEDAGASAPRETPAQMPGTAPVEPPAQAAPIDWKDLVAQARAQEEETQIQEQAPEQAAPPHQPSIPGMDAETERLLREAGEQARDTLFKNIVPPQNTDQGADDEKQ